MTRRMPPKKWPVRTVCGLPAAAKHDPMCTADRRVIDGCGCGEDEWRVRYTARQWRARRRQYRRTHGRSDRAYAAEFEAAHRWLERASEEQRKARALELLREIEQKQLTA